MEDIKISKEKFIGSRLLSRGQRLFEIDMHSGDVQEVEYETVKSGKGQMVSGMVQHITRKAVLYKKHCYYVGAINKDNALRKYNKWKSANFPHAL